MLLAEGKKLWLKHLFPQSLCFEEVAERSVLYVCTLTFWFSMVVYVIHNEVSMLFSNQHLLYF